MLFLQKQLRGNVEIFGILFKIIIFKINSTSFQLYTIFSNFTKNVPIVPE